MITCAFAGVLSAFAGVLSCVLSRECVTKQLSLRSAKGGFQGITGPPKQSQLDRVQPVQADKIFI